MRTGAGQTVALRWALLRIAEVNGPADGASHLANEKTPERQARNERKTMKTNDSKIWKTLAGLLAASALFAGLAMAQAVPGPGAPAGKRLGPAQRVLLGALASLDLSQEQKDKIQVAVDAEKPAIQALAQKSRADGQALKDLVATSNPDPKAVGEAFLKVHQNRLAAKAERDKVQAQVEALLTPAQKAKFQGYVQAAKDAARAMGHRRGGAA
jgi:Spy/CpxP family protein refolding chaperone